MKLVHTEYTLQIEFQEGTVQRVIVESPKIMSEFIFDLKSQLGNREGKWILSQNGAVLNIHDSCEVIISIFDLEINQRKMLNALYAELETEINDTELLMDWRTAVSLLEGVLNRAIDSIGYDISYEQLELKSLFKALELRFQKNEESYLEYLLEYMQMMSAVRKTELFIFVNITSFLTAEEIKLLYKEAFYKKYYLLLLDTQDIIIDQTAERKIIIDQDYCIIDTSMK